MAIYVFECGACEERFEVTLRIADRNLPQSCPDCASENTKRIIVDVGFILKGDDWPGKNIRIDGQMRTKNKKLKVKEDEQKKDAPLAKLVPNVEGEEAESWSDAKNMAASKGKDTSSYEPLVQKEKSGDL